MLFYGLFLVLSLGKVSFAEDRLDDSVRRLSSQITRIFDEQARFDLIEKGLSEHIQGKIATRQQNLEEISANSQAKFQKFVNLKIKAVKKLVETAEKVTEESNPPPGQDPTKFERECREYSSKIAKKNVFNVTKDEDFRKTAVHINVESYHKIAKKNVFNVTKDEDFRKTAVHINVESYQCDNAVLRDFEWTGSEMMEQQFRENQETDPSIIRQYIGTNSGLTRMLPAIKWIAEPVEVTMDLFDPRYRPWFTAAESAPKDAIFLIDYSGSVKGQTLHLMKITIQFVLTTLTTNDYFSAIWYNSRTGYILDECCGQDFLPATTKNKRLLLTQLDKIEERDVANLAQALNETFDRFERSLEVSEKFKKTLGDAGKSGGHKIVLLFTDGIENWPNLVIDEYKNEFPDEIVSFP
uniref:VWFA domain-containing protein n=1 Tax=Panagrolaimus sp. JU765 TaxID=591449 RepID=A0AC34QD41_9BILA